MIKKLVGNLYIVLIYRLLIIYILYFICRIAFYIVNIDLFSDIKSTDFIYMLLGGLKFDTTAIIYTNSLFILSQIIPFNFRKNIVYQKVASIFFFVTNSIALLPNVVDVFYYKITLKRTTSMVFEQFANEVNMHKLILQFIIDYWYGAVFLVLMILFMVFLYRRNEITHIRLVKNKILSHFNMSILMLIILFLCWGGIRGGFAHSIRPITLSNAGEYVSQPNEMSIVLNTPFSIIRTIGKRGLEPKEYFDNSEANKYFSSFYKLSNSGKQHVNVVIFILESWGKEYIGFYNKGLDNGYTPFFDSILNESLTFKYSYANGRKSIEALPSVLTSIPTVKVPFILSHYSGNKIKGLAHYLKEEGYYSAFFHGAPNGSMGFNSFVKMAGFDDYFGKDEFNNDKYFDGMWGIWDEEFLQFFAEKMNTFQQPFLTSVFTLSSHHPYEVPDKYKDSLPNGEIPLHRVLRYTDIALKNFFEKASKMSWFENTVFVFTADHASFPYLEEYKNELGYYAIPIAFYKPDGSFKKFDSVNVAQQLDIMPTVLSYIGYDTNINSFGKNLLDSSASNFSTIYFNDCYHFFNDSLLLQMDDKDQYSIYKYKVDSSLRYDISKSDFLNNELIVNKSKAFIQDYSFRMVYDSIVSNYP